MHESGSPLDIPPEAMRAMGYQVIDRLVDRHVRMREEPVWQGATRADLEERVRESAPIDAGSFDAALERLFEQVLPWGARVDHPRFMAFVPGAPTWAAVLGDLVAAGTNTFQGTWLASAGASTIELIVIDWFKDWLGLDRQAAGLMVSGGSVANLTALATARLTRFGAHDSSATLYLSTETHSSVFRAATTLGFHGERIRRVPVDSDQRVDVSRLRSMIDQDRARELVPFAVVANAGTTSTGAIDPLVQLADLCAEEDVWLHADAAYGGFAALTGRGRAALAGLDRADSITLDPHKWLYQPFEAGCLIVRDGHLLERAFSIMPSYLQDTALPAADAGESSPAGPLPVNFANRGIQLTRSARALKVWLSIETHGIDACRDAIDCCLDLAQHAERRIRGSRHLELVTPARLGIVCFRIRADRSEQGDGEDLNRTALDMLLESGAAMISSTRVDGSFTLRICVLNFRTREDDIDAVIDWFDGFRPPGTRPGQAP